MAGGGGNAASNPIPAPKILLAKPGLVTSAKFNRSGAGGGADEDSTALRSRLPPVASLNLLSESWDFQIDRFLPFLTDNTEFTVVGVIGPPGVGKSTILNEIYGFEYDSSSPGMLPPFGVESEETKAMARHLTVGIEPRISSERIILLDTQPVFSPSVLAEMIRPDGSSTISVMSGESLSAELAHEMMSIQGLLQLGVLLASICHMVIVVSEGVHDPSMWRLMLTADLLKHGIPDPSSITLSHPQTSAMSSDKENITSKPLDIGDEYIAAPIFVHTRVQDRDITPCNSRKMKKALTQCFSTSSFIKSADHHSSDVVFEARNDSSTDLKLFLVPSNGKDGDSRLQYESHLSVLWKLRDQVLSTSPPSFSRTVSERDWLKNSGKIWELIKNSPLIADYCKTLQSSGLYRK